MHISPINFKGTISIYKNTPNYDYVEEHYHTTKQQDKDLFEITNNTIKNNRTKKASYTKDTLDFRNKIEEIICKPLEDYNPTTPKWLLLGGVPEGMNNVERYNSAYNKIFYKDTNTNFFSPKVMVVVDALEPEERKEAASIAMNRIQETLKNDYEIRFDERLDMDLISLSNKSIVDFPKVEKILAKTLFYLDGNVDTPDPIDYAPKLYNARQAYLALFNRLQKNIGINIPEKEHAEAIATFKDEKMEYMKRAVGYLIRQEQSKSIF